MYKRPWITCEVHQETLKIFSWLWIKAGVKFLKVLFDPVVVLSVVLSSTQIHVVYIPRR